jgi:hypothetical protein
MIWREFTTTDSASTTTQEALAAWRKSAWQTGAVTIDWPPAVDESVANDGHIAYKVTGLILRPDTPGEVTP